MLKATTVIHDIRIAHGDEGRRLAALQAKAILDVLTWAAERQRPVPEAAADNTAAESPRDLNER
ncbi:hypothetical protein ACFQS1_39605 [Paractinoplanes rhizophilus]|uniref:Uncharacterized protein n=1 Tax=Paractinoplanes rhizophilus TaxID=1416877 RepID=A0ABW2I5G8_9ACTN